jgi:hypothetical protein
MREMKGLLEAVLMVKGWKGIGGWRNSGLGWRINVD